MYVHRHLPPPQLEDLLDHLPARSTNALLLLHAAKVCPKCSSLAQASAPQDDTATDIHMARALGLQTSTDRMEAIRLEAFHLRTLVPGDRLPAIQRAAVRFRSPLLVVALLARVRRQLHASPDDALELADMATAVAEHGARDPALTALALAYTGNVLRSVGRLDLADPYLERALDHLLRAPEPPLWLRAEIRSLQGSLLKDHRFLDDAELHLLNAAAMFKASSDPERVVRVRLKLATVYRLTGHPHRALTTVQQALEMLNPWRFPRLHLAVLHSLALYLCETDKPDLAQALVELCEPLYASYQPVLTRRDWLRGLIHRSLGEVPAAEHHLRQALCKFIEDDSSFLAAFVAVDLAELLLAEGRADEVVEVTQHLPGLFRSLDVHPEAVAATLLFHKAAAEQQVTEEHVTLFRSFLERAQVDRSASFAAPMA